MPAVLPETIEPLETHEIPAEYDHGRMQRFVAETAASGGSELANAQSIFRDLCAAIGVPPPDLKRPHGTNAYVFEEDVKDDEDRNPQRIDVYKRGCFVFEAKQGVFPSGKHLTAVGGGKLVARRGHAKSIRGAGVRGTADWTDAMRSGRHQAGRYAVSAAQRGDPKPPFLIVADVGHCLWIWSSFTGDPREDYGTFDISAAFRWADLERPEVVHLLRQIWLNPEALNDEVLGQKVTAEIAGRIGDLAKHLERRFAPEDVGDFLMKCVFTMFAEDVEFLPRGLFERRLKGWIEDAHQGRPERFARGLRALWTRMRDGGDLDSGHAIRRFNGYLFRDAEPLDLEFEELVLLGLAAGSNWRRVSPAIFGTLLERALSPEERKRLGAFYTPESYIHRLVEWTIMEPLRDEWAATRAQMELVLRKGGDIKKAQTSARKLAHEFRKRLASIRILDPACGSGNFLYVAMKEMKRLEGEVTRALVEVGEKQTWLDIPGDTVHPRQFHGIEIKPWAAKIAELVLWIGYLQWQVSARRVESMPEPILQDLHPIENRDALVTWDEEENVLDDKGRKRRRATRVTAKTGSREQVEETRLVNVEAAEWPDAEFIVGNPPFVGNKRMMDVLRPAYTTAVREAFPNVPGNADFVMYWWAYAAELLAKRKIRRFGFVTTYTVAQTFNRAVLERAQSELNLRIVHALANHPWYDEGAQIRIAMTVVSRSDEVRPSTCTHAVVVDEQHTSAGELHLVRVVERAATEIHADLSTGAKIRSAKALRANADLCSQGITPLGDGFRVDEKELAQLHVKLPHAVVKSYLIGQHLMRRPRREWIIDFHGLSEEDAAAEHPRLFEHVVRTVKPIREAQNDPTPKRRWWLFGRTRPELRKAIADLSRYIVTSRTSRHRVFLFVPADTLADTKIVAIATEDAAHLAILSSRVHVAWATQAGGRHGVGNDPTYNHTEAFDPFPFPSASDAAMARLRDLGERLDAHRKARQAEHPLLSLGEMYGVLVKLRAGAELTDDERSVRDAGLVDTLGEVHAEIDRETLDAYGWAPDLPDADVIANLVALNADRQREEQSGVVRWLRPEYQAGQGQQPTQLEVVETVEAAERKPAKRKTTKSARAAWPADLPGRIRALTALLRVIGAPTPASDLATAFKAAKLDDVELTLRCAAAADAVFMLQVQDGPTRWAARDPR